MRFTEFFQTIPQLAMAVVLVAVLSPSVYSIMGAIALVSWPPAARLVRSEFMTLKQREFVQAAIVIGQTPSRIVCRSEEHTSELQSLMRSSYAVFCLKKNNTYHYDAVVHDTPLE